MATQSHDTAARGQAQGRKQGNEAAGATHWLKRTAVGVLGGVLLVRGLRRRGLRGIAMAVAGGWLLTRATGTTDRVAGTIRSGTGLGESIVERTTRTEPTSVTRSITIGEPADELYETWRDPDRLSQIVGHFADVEATDEDILRWTATAPGGREVSWDTRIVEAEPGERLRWETPGDAMIPNEGELRFRTAPGDQGTEVELTIDFDPPGGAVGAAAMARLDVVPETVVAEALRRYKRLAETGEIPTLADNPSGRGRGDRV